MDVLIPLGTVGAALTVHPDTAIPHPKSKLKIQLSFDPVVLESASYLHMRGIRVTIQRVSPAASQNKWAAPFALMRRTRT